MNPSEQFEVIVSEHYEILFKFAMSLTRSVGDAEDLTQETFYTWARKGHQLRDPSKVKTWLFTTLHREFLAGRRRQLKFQHPELDSVAEELPPSDSPEIANRMDSSSVLPALAKVDEVYQAAVALFYLDDLSYEAIAKVLEIPVGTVKSRLSRGIKQLRRILQPADALPRVESTNRDLSPTHRLGTKQ